MAKSTNSTTKLQRYSSSKGVIKCFDISTTLVCFYELRLFTLVLLYIVYKASDVFLLQLFGKKIHSSLFLNLATNCNKVLLFLKWTATQHIFKSKHFPSTLKLLSITSMEERQFEENTKCEKTQVTDFASSGTANGLTLSRCWSPPWGWRRCGAVCPGCWRYGRTWASGFSPSSSTRASAGAAPWGSPWAGAAGSPALPPSSPSRQEVILISLRQSVEHANNMLTCTQLQCWHADNFHLCLAC